MSNNPSYKGHCTVILPDEFLARIANKEQLEPVLFNEIQEYLSEDARQWIPEGVPENLYLIVTNPSGASLLCRVTHGVITQLRCTDRKFHGLKAANAEQHFALDALTDPDIQCVTIEGRAGSGKAQPLDAHILTPLGWKRMGDIRPGDMVIAADGRPTRVLSIHPQGEKQIYKVYFDDGGEAECCLEHLWEVKKGSGPDRGIVMSLEHVIDELNRGESLYVEVPKAAQTDGVSFLDIDPYLAGMIAGSPVASFSEGLWTASTSIGRGKTVEDEVNLLSDIARHASHLYENCYIVNDVGQSWFNLEWLPSYLWSVFGTDDLTPEVWEHRRIPPSVFTLSISQRLEFLQGICDSRAQYDGRRCVLREVGVHWSQDLVDLARSLGGVASETPVLAADLRVREVEIKMPQGMQPYRYHTKNLKRWVPHYTRGRRIVSVAKSRIAKAQCILVEDKRHLYITDDYILTHNTICTLAAALDQVKSLGRKKRGSGLYERLVLTRPLSSVGKSLGYLPGDEKQKTSPYLLGYFHNLEQLGMDASYFDMLTRDGKIEFIPIALLGGASFHNTLLVVDECQAVDPLIYYTLGTRLAESSKVVFLGDRRQTYRASVVREETGMYRFVNSEHSISSPLTASVRLEHALRSPLCDIFHDTFFPDEDDTL